jgi:predicted nucleic acid-binding protein
MRFSDTNILLYSLDLEPAQPAKAAIAKQILSSTDLALSVEVRQEF